MSCEVIGYMSFISGGSVVIATIVALEWLNSVFDRVQISVTSAHNRNKLIDELHAHTLELEEKIEKLESERNGKMD